jgi:excisionase family DNA binding protein
LPIAWLARERLGYRVATMPTDPEPLLTPEQLAEAIGMSRKSVYRLAREGAIPSYRFGDSLRFKLGEVLEAARQAPATGARDRSGSEPGEKAEA